MVIQFLKGLVSQFGGGPNGLEYLTNPSPLEILDPISRSVAARSHCKWEWPIAVNECEPGVGGVKVVLLEANLDQR